MFYHFMANYTHFRNVYYLRYPEARLLAFLLPSCDTLHITTKQIGGGVFIEHGFAKIISAKRIGENCIINQQVTIGYSDATHCPIIGNNVHVCAGAILIGGITIGDNSIIGAGAIVTKDVPANAVLTCEAARVIKINGERI